MSSAIVVQCFVKADTLAGLLQSLLRCERREDYHLILWSDVPGPGPKGERYQPQNQQVRADITSFAASHGRDFASVSVMVNDRNRGTAGTCQASLNHAFSLHDFVIFTEDDTVFARDALVWFAELRDMKLLAAPDVLAFAGESIYFDARNKPLPQWYPAQARRLASVRDLTPDYVRLKFLPSTCFATTREKWATFGEIRGHPRGAEEVCVLCREQNLFALFPVVARVKDIGMLHESGYSVGIHGAEGVREIKNTYLMADDLPPRAGPPRLFTGNMDQLFQDSAKLTGFTAPPARPAARTWKLWSGGSSNEAGAFTEFLLRHYKVPFEAAATIGEATLLAGGAALEELAPQHGPAVIWSAGLSHAVTRPLQFSPAVRILGLRGYLSESMITPLRHTDLVIGDAALLARRVFNHDAATKINDLGIVGTKEALARAASLGAERWAGVKLIDVRAPSEQIMRDIAACRRILTFSQLGAVLADAFAIPNAIAIAGSDASPPDTFEAADHASALGYDVARVTLDTTATREASLAAIDQLPPHAPPTGAMLDDLEMSLHVLQAAGRGLCEVG